MLTWVLQKPRKSGALAASTRAAHEMTCTIRFLNSIRQSLCSMRSASHHSSFFCSSRFVDGKFEPIKRCISLSNKYSKFQSKLRINTQHVAVAQQFSGGKRLRIRSLLGISCIIGYMSFSAHVAYAMDGHDILVDDRDYSSASNGEPDSQALWMFIRKFWLPVLCFLTVLLNWDYPIILTTKVVLLLLSTKPSPLSVYVFVEQLCHQYMRREPHLYFLKSLYANKVEVKDYKLLCLARVEIQDQKFRLLGILGGWWPLPLSHGSYCLPFGKLGTLAAAGFPF